MLQALDHDESYATLLSYWIAEAGWSPPGTLELDFDAYLITDKDVAGFAHLLTQVEDALSAEGKADSAYLARIVAQFLQTGYGEIALVHRPQIPEEDANDA